MRKSRLTLARAGLGVLAALVLTAPFVVTGVAEAGASTCSRHNCFGVTVSTTRPVAGDRTSFTFTISNESSGQRLNAVTIKAPRRLQISGVSGSGKHKFTAGSATFRRLGLRPKHSTALTVTATAPCADVSYKWGVAATFDGDHDADDFTINPASKARLSGTVTGKCSLSFGAQPGGTAGGAAITSGFDSAGGPVQVDVLSGTGHLVQDSTAPVTVAIAANPAAGILSGTDTVAASGGIASFSGLSIDKPGIGYTLAAASPGITPGTSDDFTIWGSILGCTSSSCSASASSSTTTGSVSTSTASAGQFLGIGLGGVSYTCGSYPLTSDPVSFDVLSTDGVAQSGGKFLAKLEISNAAVQASGHPWLRSWHICYASTTSFAALPHTGGSTVIGGQTYYTGLLPECSAWRSAPCMLARYRDHDGDVIITFLASGDPVYRG